MQTNFPNAKPAEYAVQMIYDPASRLFEWESFPTYQGCDPALSATQFAKNSFLFLGPDRLVILPRAVFPSPVPVRESTERQDSMDQGQASVLRFFEARSGTVDTLWNAPAKNLDLMKEIPPHFMDERYSAIRISPSIQELRRNGKQWLFRITGPNGNSAEVSTDDSFQILGTKLLPRAPVIVENEAGMPTVHGMRDGISSPLQAYELLLNIGNGCSLPSYLRVLTVYDPPAKLFLWFPEGSPEFASNQAPFPDDLTTQILQNSIFTITEEKIVAFSSDTETVRQSSARFASLQDAQASLLSEIAKPQSPPSAPAKQLPLTSLLVPMQYYVPKRTPPSWRSVTHAGGRWRLQLEWSAGPLKQATLFLDEAFNPLSADLTYATPPAKIGGIASWPLLSDTMRDLKDDQLALPPPSELTITDKSSAIHAMKNGRPVEVQAHLVDIHREGKMLAVYDPTSRLFWCVYEPNGIGDNIGYYASQLEKGNAWLLVTDEKILDFDAVSSNSFTGVQASFLRYASFGEGLTYALTAVCRNQGHLRDGHVYFDLQLPLAFLTQPTALYNVTPRYRGIARPARDWQLVLAGADGATLVMHRRR